LNTRDGGNVFGAAWAHVVNTTPGAKTLTDWQTDRLLVSGATNLRQIMPLLRDWGVLTDYMEVRRLAKALAVGPLVVESWWNAGFFEVDAHGWAASQDRATHWHAYALVGFDHQRDAFRVQNSLGPGWGHLGRAWIPSSWLLPRFEAGGTAILPMLAGVELLPGKQRVVGVLKDGEEDGDARHQVA
jgi:hypothetical protein